MKPINRWQAGLAILMLSGATNWAVATIRLNNTDMDFRIVPFDYQIDPNRIYAELLSSINGSGWQPVHVAGGTESVFKVSENGYFDAGVGVIPNAPDDAQVAFELRAWFGGNSFENAIAWNQETWTQIAGSWDPGSGLPATGPVLLIPYTLVIGVPEPSTLALTIVGGGVLVGFRRLGRGTKHQ